MLPHSDSKKVPKIECECLQHNLKRQKVLQKLPMLKVLLLHGGTPNIICLKTYFLFLPFLNFQGGDLIYNIKNFFLLHTRGGGGGAYGL